MPQHTRIDAPIIAKRDEWLPIVEAARAASVTRGLPTPPPGIQPRTGAYYCTSHSKRSDGTVRVFLKWCSPGYQTTTLGSYLVARSIREDYPVGKVITLACGRQVRVALVDGLPYPEPVR